MILKCPACNSEEFHLIIERQWSFKVSSVGLTDVVPGELCDELPAKELICDDCDFRGWIDEYHLAKSGVVTVKQSIDTDQHKTSTPITSE